MTTFDSPRYAVESTLTSSFTLATWVSDNVPPPEGESVRVLIETGSTGVALTGGGSGQIDIGKNVTQRHTGVAVFELRVEKNQGTARTNQIIESLHNLFVNKRINDVTFKRGEPRRIGEQNNMYRVDYYVFFSRDSR